MVSIAAFQAVDPGSIPGRRNFFPSYNALVVPFWSKSATGAMETRWPSG